MNSLCGACPTTCSTLVGSTVLARVNPDLCDKKQKIWFVAC